MISSFISELLHEQPLVIVPGLGAFVSMMHPAYYDEATRTLNPPGREFSFSRMNNCYDLVLARRIALQQNCSLAEAGHMIEAFNEQVLKALKSGQTFQIEDLGYLYLDAHGTVQFQSQKRINHSDVFGLPGIRVEPILHEAVSPAAAQTEILVPVPLVHKETQEGRVQAQPMVRRALPRVHPAVAAVLATAFGVALGVSYHKSVQAPAQAIDLAQTARINVPPQVNITSYEPVAESAPEPTILEPSVLKKPLTPNDIPPAPPTVNSGKKAIFIIGSFAQKNNVVKAKAAIRSQGHTPYVDIKNGLTRVGAIINYNDAAQLEENVHLLKKSFGHAVRIK